MNAAKRAAPLALLLPLALSGCLFIPLSGNKIVSGERVEKDDIGALRHGVTTRVEVLERLGPPHIHWEDAKVFVYEWETLEAIMPWGFGAGLGGAAGILPITEEHALLLRFDEHDVLQRSELRNPWNDYGAFLEQWVASGEAKPNPGKARQ